METLVIDGGTLLVIAMAGEYLALQRPHRLLGRGATADAEAGTRPAGRPDSPAEAGWACWGRRVARSTLALSLLYGFYRLLT